jgi:hypothetical protein
VNQKDEEDLIILTNLLNYESEVLCQFMNLGVFFISKTTQPIRSHKVKSEALCHFNIEINTSED